MLHLHSNVTQPPDGTVLVFKFPQDEIISDRELQNLNRSFMRLGVLRLLCEPRNLAKKSNRTSLAFTNILCPRFLGRLLTSEITSVLPQKKTRVTSCIIKVAQATDKLAAVIHLLRIVKVETSASNRHDVYCGFATSANQTIIFLFGISNWYHCQHSEIFTLF
jgi:hypothetical protein